MYMDILKKRVLRIALVLLMFVGVLYISPCILGVKEFSLSELIGYYLAGSSEIGGGAYWYLYSYIGFLLLVPIFRKITRSMTKADFLFLTSTDKQYGKLRDKKDVPVLSDAIYYDVDVILSGDKDFLEAGLEHPAVKSVSELWDFLGFDNL